MDIKHKIDSNGYYLEDVYTDENSEYLINTRFPEGLFKPRWVNGEWIDDEGHKRADLDASLYKEYRKKHYPPVEDFLDAVVKGDEEAKTAYINKCLEVKELFPKGVIPDETLEP